MTKNGHNKLLSNVTDDGYKEKTYKTKEFGIVGKKNWWVAYELEVG